MRTLFVGFVAAATCVGLAPSPASAEPDTVEEAREALDQIQQEASSIDQQIIEATARAEEAAERLDEINADLDAQKDKVEGMGEALGSMAVMQMQSGGFHVTAQLLTSESDENFLSSLGTIQNETDRGNSDLQAFQVEQARLVALEEEAQSVSEAMDADLAEKQELATDYEEKEAEAEEVLDRLEEEERQRLIALQEQREREQAARDAAAAAAAANRGEAPSAGSDATADQGGESSADPVVSDGSRAARAAQLALGKAGSSYVWGSSGPSTFDCSGLTSWAYAQVGVSLPRSSRAQAGMGTPVSKGNLQPGDLVFYYSPISHVGIYIGNGQIIHAANPRTGVRVTGLNSMPFSGARRVA